MRKRLSERKMPDNHSMSTESSQELKVKVYDMIRRLQGTFSPLHDDQARSEKRPEKYPKFTIR